MKILTKLTLCWAALLLLVTGLVGQQVAEKRDLGKRREALVGSVQVHGSSVFTLTAQPDLMIVGQGGGVLVHQNPPLVVTSLAIGQHRQNYSVDGQPAVLWKVDEVRELAFLLAPGLGQEQPATYSSRLLQNELVYTDEWNASRARLKGCLQACRSDYLFVSGVVPDKDSRLAGSGMFDSLGDLLGVIVRPVPGFKVLGKNYSGVAIVGTTKIADSLSDSGGWIAECSRCKVRFTNIDAIEKDLSYYDRWMHKACHNTKEKKGFRWR